MFFSFHRQPEDKFHVKVFGIWCVEDVRVWTKWWSYSQTTNQCDIERQSQEAPIRLLPSQDDGLISMKVSCQNLQYRTLILCNSYHHPPCHASITCLWMAASLFFCVCKSCKMFYTEGQLKNNFRVMITAIPLNEFSLSFDYSFHRKC